jgi:hypothetical protein
MSASIRIESGIAAGTSYWIDRPVLRIGSDPQCEICVPSADLAPHALTLEFRGGTYRAYNRGTASFNVGRSTVQPGTAAAWNEGETVVLPGDLRLALAVDGDPRPSPRPETRINDGIDEPEAVETGANATATPEAAQKAKSKSTLQMAVIAVCLLATGGLLYLSNTGGFDSAPPANRPNFDTIVRTSLKKDANIRKLVEKLQFAQSFIVRGHDEYAKLVFSELRDQLIRQIDTMPPDDRKDAADIRDYVEMQLGQFQ